MFDAHRGNMKRGHARRGGAKGFATNQSNQRRPSMQQGMQGNRQPMQGRPCMQQGLQGKGQPMQGRMSQHSMHQGMKSGSGMKGKPGMKSYHGNKSGATMTGISDFTDEQQEQLKSLRLEQMKAMTQHRNSLDEYKAKLKTITSVDAVKLKEVDKVLDEMGKIKLEMAKNKLSHQQDVRAMLTDEQKVMFDMRHSHGVRSRGRL